MARLEERLKDKARALGFDVVGIAPAAVPEAAATGLETFIAEGRHGTMAWLAATLARRRHPRALWPEARTAIVCAMNYGPPEGLDPLARLKRRDRGIVSLYALRRDYHDVIKGRLKHLAQWLVKRTGADVKVFVDTAPLLERPLAAQTGIGWTGKHTCVLSRAFGNWLFLGVILTTARLAPDAPARAHCGSCTACLDICPTGAFIGPRRLDARRCISYLTIEHSGPVPRALRPLMGNRIFGCDDCLAVCPWNKHARTAKEAKLALKEELVDLPLADLAKLDEAAFRRLFATTPVRRAGYGRFMANVLIAIGNSAEAALADLAATRLDDPHPLIRAMAVWALRRLWPREAWRAGRARALVWEHDQMVRAEWLADEMERTA